MDSVADTVSRVAQDLLDKIERREALVAIIGLGYVGLPLAISFAMQGVRVVGFDVDQKKVNHLNASRTYIKTIPEEMVAKAVQTGRLSASSDISVVTAADAIVICVPTPLNKNREPDLSYVSGTAEMLVPYLRKGQMVSLESTTYPGTTDEVMRPILAKSGLEIGTDIFLVYSPEREDPGNQSFSTSTTPKVVGGENGDALTVGCALYAQVVEKVVPVANLATAEAVKLTENIFRAVNIALVNELKVTYERMGIDVWDVIEAAKTKPFGYMPFYPGPGLGGHCIPIDPFYLTWKAREYGIATRFIELAGEINNAMPDYVIRRLKDALDERSGRGLNGARILLVGMAYKKNVDDTRESPSLHILEALVDRGARVDYLDPFVKVVPPTRRRPELAGRETIAEADIEKGNYDAALICTDHDAIDYQHLVSSSKLVVDTRNATKNVTTNTDRIVKA